MSEVGIVHIIWLLGALVLVSAGLAGHRLTFKRGLSMALLWIGIFVGVTLFIDLVR